MPLVVQIGTLYHTVVQIGTLYHTVGSLSFMSVHPVPGLVVKRCLLAEWPPWWLVIMVACAMDSGLPVMVC